MIYEKVGHPGHPSHKLKPYHSQTRFTCDGCKEVGLGSRYRCKPCHYDLHKECAHTSSSITHSYFKKCAFEFMKQGKGRRYCDACAGDIKGFVYHCNDCKRDLHPCCVNLPRRIQIEGSHMELLLRDRVSSECHVCERKKLVKGQTWSYVSACGEYHFHVSCVKVLLMEIWVRASALDIKKIEKNKHALERITPEKNKLALEPITPEMHKLILERITREKNKHALERMTPEKNKLALQPITPEMHKLILEHITREKNKHALERMTPEMHKLALERKTPNLPLALHNRRIGNGSRLEKYLRMGKAIVKFIISAIAGAIFGDPTGVVGGLLVSVFSS